MPAVDLCISIINHSNPHLLRDCLASLYEHPTTLTREIWVVDNATDGTDVAAMKRDFPEVRWLHNDRRLGFSANHNQVLRRCTARYACILNDDIVMLPGCFEALIEHLDAHPEVGLVGPRTLNADGTLQDSTYQDKTLAREWLITARLPARVRRRLRVGLDAVQHGTAPADVDWLLGACLVIRRDTLDFVGLLDEKLSPIATVEETDWAMRVRQAGWAVQFVPAAKLIHLGGQSRKSGGGGFGIRAEQHRCTVRLFRKHYGPLAAAALRGVYLSTLPWNLTAGLLACARGAVTLRQAKWDLELDLRVALGLR